jgi:hypothetical protein
MFYGMKNYYDTTFPYTVVSSAVSVTQPVSYLKSYLQNYFPLYLGFNLDFNKPHIYKMTYLDTDHIHYYLFNEAFNKFNVPIEEFILYVVYKENAQTNINLCYCDFDVFLPQSFIITNVYSAHMPSTIENIFSIPYNSSVAISNGNKMKGLKFTKSNIDYYGFPYRYRDYTILIEYPDSSPSSSDFQSIDMIFFSLGKSPELQTCCIAECFGITQ